MKGKIKEEGRHSKDQKEEGMEERDINVTPKAGKRNRSRHP